ncbi:MAG: hypothetical protein KDB22_03925 [Planctomycetales bacterium]|nr:hypothetical protein [Planctomycetales bacterium]
MSKSTTLGEQQVEISRRRKERRTNCTAVNDTESQFKPPRRKKQRRRQIDPTTCERDYNQEEIEFMQSLDAYKRSSGRMFPTCSEILEVVRGLGYVRLSDEERKLFEGIEAVERDLATSSAEEVELDCDELDEIEEMY